MMKFTTSRWDASRFVETLRRKGVDDEDFLGKVKWALEIYSYLAHIGVDIDPIALDALKEADKILQLRDTYEE